MANSITVPARYRHADFFQEKLNMLESVAKANGWKIARATDDRSYFDVYFVPSDNPEALAEIDVDMFLRSGEPMFVRNQDDPPGSEVVYTIDGDGKSDLLRFVNPDVSCPVCSAATSFGILLISINKAMK